MRNRKAFPCVAAVVVGLVVPACASDLSREEAKEILDRHLAATGTETRDVPLGAGMHIGLNSAGDFGAPIRSDMLAVYRELEGRGLIRLVDRGPLSGWGDAVRTFDAKLTSKGVEVLGPIQEGRPNYTSASAYGLPRSFLRIEICRRTVTEVTGIRILTPGVEVEVEYDWACKPTSDLAEMVRKTRKDFLPAAPPSGTEGSGATRLALYDDGWRVKEEPGARR